MPFSVASARRSQISAPDEDRTDSRAYRYLGHSCRRLPWLITLFASPAILSRKKGQSEPLGGRLEISRHTRNIECMIFLVKNRIAIKPNRLFRNPSRAKEVTDRFRNQQNDLQIPLTPCKTRIWVRRTMVGRIYVSAPVSSNMMTTTETVIRMTPLRKLRKLP